MIEKQTRSKKNLERKRPAYFYIDSSEDEKMKIDADVDSYEEMNNKSEKDERDECERILKETWKNLRQPVAEDSITAEWYEVS